MIAGSEKKRFPEILAFLPLVALSVDLLTPFLIWKNILPASFRWGSHVFLVIMIFVSIARMLVFKHVPLTFWIFLAISALWSYIAIGYGQGVISTIWGVWLLFQFPFVALFSYLQPNLPNNFAANLRKSILVILGIQLLVQLLQYATGELPGDNLAGLFGEHGTGIALFFIILVNCIFLGYWISSKKWGGFIASLFLGSLVSALGEIKLYPLAITAIGLMATAIYALKYRALGRALSYLLIIVMAMFGFVYIYNSIVPGAERVPIQTYIQNPDRLYEYLTFSEGFYTSEGTLTTDMGRMYAVKVGWESIQEDPVKLLFGYGIGARSESRTLGQVGIGLSTGDLGVSVGTSLLVLMQEMGLVGLIVLGSFIVYIVLSLIRDIQKFPSSCNIELRYALLLFSLLWPLWLWYANIWTMRVPMLIYWYMLGYLFAESRNPLFQKNKPHEACKSSRDLR